MSDEKLRKLERDVVYDPSVLPKLLRAWERNGIPVKEWAPRLDGLGVEVPEWLLLQLLEAGVYSVARRYAIARAQRGEVTSEAYPILWEGEVDLIDQARSRGSPVHIGTGLKIPARAIVRPDLAGGDMVQLYLNHEATTEFRHDVQGRWLYTPVNWVMGEPEWVMRLIYGAWDPRREGNPPIVVGHSELPRGYKLSWYRWRANPQDEARARRNPDEDLRRLERLAAAGDEDAAQKLARMRQRYETPISRIDQWVEARLEGDADKSWVAGLVIYLYTSHPVYNTNRKLGLVNWTMPRGRRGVMVMNWRTSPGNEDRRLIAAIVADGVGRAALLIGHAESEQGRIMYEAIGMESFGEWYQLETGSAARRRGFIDRDDADYKLVASKRDLLAWARTILPKEAFKP